MKTTDHLPENQRTYKCSWKHYERLDQVESRGEVTVQASCLSDAIVKAKKAVFDEHDISSVNVEIVTIEEDFL